jgi:hypothetical protein
LRKGDVNAIRHENATDTYPSSLKANHDREHSRVLEVAAHLRSGLITNEAPASAVPD